MGNITLALCALLVLSACATPIPKSETIPDYPVKPAANTAIGVVDLRPFVIGGDKEEWFEGTMRVGFDFPHPMGRNGDFEEKPFAFYLATKLKESVEEAGGKATIVTIPKGTLLEDSISEIARRQTDAGLLVMMHQSQYDLGMANPEYFYFFDVVVLGKTGKVLARKEFRQSDPAMTLSNKYNLFDFMSDIYKREFDGILADPDIKNALIEAAR